MKKTLLILTVLFAGTLMGCETVKGTVNGAGCGMNKDYKNTEKFVKEIPPKAMELDAWMQKNMW